MLLILTSTAVSFATESDLARLLRYPDVSRTDIAFVHGGDLYVVPRQGGTAQRLTSSPGEELYPKFSPDGRWIAFSAEYTGTRQVWVVPTAGGPPRQLTWYNDVGALPVRGGTDNRVLDWTPDGNFVVVRMNRVPWDERGGRPYLVPVNGGMEQPLAVPETGGGSLSPDGSHYVYTPIDADWRGWKRYRGGRAPDVWTYDLVANQSTRLTTFRGMDQNPAWIGDAVYFASDRTGTLNLYVMPASAADESQPPRAVTNFTDFDVLWTSGGPDAVVFEQAGYVWRYDAGATEAVRVPIRLVDDSPDALPVVVPIGKFIESASIAPDGARVAFGARGEVFTVPARDGEARNLTLSPAIREHSVAWSPDAKWVVYLSERTGEYELEVRAQDGTGDARTITNVGGPWKFPPVWSPDSQSIAFADKNQLLRVVDVRSGRIRDVDHADHAEFSEYVWSPDSRWLAYTKVEANEMASIWVWSADTGTATGLTSGAYDEFSPAFDPKGRYLFFLSNRNFDGLTRGAFDDTFVYTKATRIYAGTLSAAAPPLDVHLSDEVKAPATGENKEPVKKEPEKKTERERITFDLDGFERRVVALDAPPSDYSALTATPDAVLFLDGGALQRLSIERSADERPTIETVSRDVAAYELTADRKKALVRTGGDVWSVIDVKPDQDPSKTRLALDRVTVRVDPRVEWPQMYNDAWRLLRDWFYDPGMHGGLDRWAAIRDRYAPLAAAVTSPSDFDYVLHELTGEVNAGHVYVNRGPRDPNVERRPGGLLGADFASDPSGYFRVVKVFAGESWSASARSPLAAPGVNVMPGDYLLSVDGVDARTVHNVYQLLEGKGGRAVELRVNDRPSEKGARTVWVITVESEQELRYLDWVEERRSMVERLSGGRIGYMHIANTSQVGQAQINTWLPALRNKEALIIDDRYNGGGFIPDQMANQLARTPLSWWKRRGLTPSPSPSVVHRGPKVMLINGMSSSGGDALPYYFRELGLGPLIGTRTWGGLIGISGNPGLSDGSSISIPNFRFMAPDGSWAVENEGVAPDIEVVDRPELVAAGRDPSLERGVELLLKALAERPITPIEAPPAPVQFD